MTALAALTLAAVAPGAPNAAAEQAAGAGPGAAAPTQAIGAPDALITFVGPNYFPAAQLPSALAVGDLNEDGRPDVVTADRQANTISILRGLGGGRLSAPATFPVGGALEFGDVALADFDDDGHLDVATDVEGSDAVAVLFGNGRAGLSAPVTFAVGDAPVSTQAADVDGDGNPDLVVANAFSDDVSVLLGDGQRGFAPAVNYPVGEHPRGLSIADLDEDGALDVVVANRVSADVTVLLGAGDGRFVTGPTLGVDRAPVDTVIAHFDADANLDIAVVTSDIRVLDQDRLWVFPGDGNGGFRPARTMLITDTVTSVAAADLDDDGLTDLVTSHIGAFRTSTVQVMLGRGESAFYLPNAISVDDLPEQVALADLDLDGDEDIATVHTDQVSTLLSDGDSPGCTIMGTSGDDVLTGTSGKDVICGLGGDDEIRGGLGDDVLLGGPGNDRLFGQSGINVLAGDVGQDRLFGGNAQDTVYGGAGNDFIKAGAGRDQLLGEAGDDDIDSADGVSRNDVTTGGSGHDSCTVDPDDLAFSCP